MSDKEVSETPEAGSNNVKDERKTAPINLKVSDGSNEIFFKIKRNTRFEKLMEAFCRRQGIDPSQKRFLVDGARVDPKQTPNDLDLEDDDVIEVHNAQLGGC